jgi:hypothetical protein
LTLTVGSGAIRSPKGSSALRLQPKAPVFRSESAPVIRVEARSVPFGSQLFNRIDSSRTAGRQIASERRGDSQDQRYYYVGT